MTTASPCLPAAAVRFALPPPFLPFPRSPRCFLALKSLARSLMTDRITAEFSGLAPFVSARFCLLTAPASVAASGAILFLLDDRSRWQCCSNTGRYRCDFDCKNRGSRAAHNLVLLLVWSLIKQKEPLPAGRCRRCQVVLGPPPPPAHSPVSTPLPSHPPPPKLQTCSARRRRE